MKRSEKSLQLKNDILDVARDLFISQGYQLTTIRQITARMGINPGSLYHFFRNKEDIFRQIVIQSYREIIDYSETVQKENRDPAFRYSITREIGRASCRERVS
jgi:AcrR family transcriptional regulator